MTRPGDDPAVEVGMPEIEPLADPEPMERLREEVAAVPPGDVLAAEKERKVLVVRGGAAPALMREIGRARERTFRLVGEGSGRARDLDGFDETYRQLVLWDEQHGVIGGYRLAYVDELLALGGRDALYTAGHFHLGDRLLDYLEDAVELGRSFVVPEHQRSFPPLLLLWRGIGAFVARSERHHLLVGAVSVSARYSVESRRDIAAFLLARGRRSPWSAMTAARRPFEHGIDAAGDVKALEQRVMLRDGAKPPVLVRQYLQLGMRGLACGVDPDFGGCLDVLCLADLRDTPRTLLERYMGEHGAHQFLRRHDYVEVA